MEHTADRKGQALDKLKYRLRIRKVGRNEQRSQEGRFVDGSLRKVALMFLIGRQLKTSYNIILVILL